MRPDKTVIVNSLLSGFQGILMDDPEVLEYTIRKLVNRHIESYKDAGKTMTGKDYLAAIGALRSNSLWLSNEHYALETKMALERKKKAGKKK
jgi:hypothetical protein